MSLRFDGSTGYCAISTPVVTSPPFTMACYFMPNNDTAEHTFMGIGDTGAANSDRHMLGFDGSAAGDPIFAVSRSGGSGASSEITTANLTHKWTHAAGVWASTTSRTAYYHGVAGTTETTSKTPAGLDVTYLGVRPAQTPSVYFAGVMAHAAIWNVALTARQVKDLACGMMPYEMMPANLVAYWPLNDVGMVQWDYGRSKSFPLSFVGGVRHWHDEPWQMDREEESIYDSFDTETVVAASQFPIIGGGIGAQFIGA